MAKTTSFFPTEVAGPNSVSQTKQSCLTAVGAAAILKGDVVGRKTADGTYAKAGIAGVAAPYFISTVDVDSSVSAQRFDARAGRFLFPNAGFYSQLKEGKEVNFTSTDAVALLAGTSTFLLGYDAKTDSIIVSCGEQLPSIP